MEILSRRLGDCNRRSHAGLSGATSPKTSGLMKKKWRIAQ
ncbi:hypothetical protein [Polaromonas sp. CG9_12]|nr:hypothetical protein [Polaromonas sp. CG9_12]